MRRVACIWLEAPRIQAFRFEQPRMRQRPVALSERIRGVERVVACSREAYRAGVRVGMRPEAARACEASLHVERDDVDRHVRLQAWLLEQAELFSPRFESPGLGMVYLDARGLGGVEAERVWLSGMVRSLEQALAGRVRGGLAGSKFAARAAACFAASSEPGMTRAVWVARGEDARFLGGVSVAGLPLDVASREALKLAGLHTLGALAALDVGALQARFGRAGVDWHVWASGGDVRPVERTSLEARLCWRQPLEGGMHHERLIFVAKRGLDSLLSELVRWGRHAESAWLRLRERGQVVREHTLRVYQPTARSGPFLDRLRLALEAASPLVAPITEVEIEVERTRVEPRSGELFGARPRDRHALSRALAQIEARLGGERVYALACADTWHPDRRTALRPFDAREALTGGTVAEEASVREGGGPVLLSLRPRRKVSEPVEVERWGPWHVTGGWWEGAEEGYERRYWMCLDGRGGLWRVYEDDSGWWLDGFWD